MDPAYQASAAIFVGSHLIAGLLVGANLKYFLISAASYGLLLLLFLGSVKFIGMSSRDKQFQRQYAEWEKELSGLSVQEARRRAQAALSDRNTFHTVEAPTAALPIELPPSIRDFFSRYDAVRATRGGLELSRELLKRLRDGYVQIGSDDDFVQIATRPEGEAVYEIESDGSASSEYPTIYHLILLREKIYNEP